MMHSYCYPSAHLAHLAHLVRLAHLARGAFQHA
jgi:hypothetical protein